MRQDGDLSGAAEFYLAAVARDPHAPEPLVRLGEADLEMGRTAQAEQSFRSALVLAPGNQSAEIGLAVALLRQAKPQEALGLLEPIARRSDDARIIRDYGVALDMLGRSSEAQSVYRRGLASSPADADLHGNLALSLAVDDHMAAAEAEIEAAVNSPNAPPRARSNKVLLLAMAGREIDARAVSTGASPLDRATIDSLVEQGRRARAAAGPTQRATALGLINASSPGSQAPATAAAVPAEDQSQARPSAHLPSAPD